jgi:hypothetical protein
MTALGLLFVGSVLFVNGLVLLGRVEPRGAAPINLFVGTLLLLVTLYLVLPARDLGPALTAAGFLLFGFTYLYVGILNITGHSVDGLGWYCAWAAGIALVLALVNFIRFDDPKFGTLWLLWTILFALFFVVLGLGATRFTYLTGWVTVIEAFITTTIPGVLLLLDEWEPLPGWVVPAVGLAAVAVFALIGLRTAAAGPPGGGAGARSQPRPAAER